MEYPYSTILTVNPDDLEYQESVVSLALNLAKTKCDLEQKKSSIQSERFKAPPYKPYQKRVKPPEYPEIPPLKFNYIAFFGATLIGIVLGALNFVIAVIESNTGVVFSIHESEFSYYTIFWISSFLTALSPIWMLIYVLIIHPKRKANHIQKTKNSHKYKKECERRNKEYQKQLDAAFKEYQEYNRKYESTLLPAYNAELQVWERAKDKRLADVSKDLEDVMQKIDYLHSATKLIPPQYRTTDRLSYILKILQTSNYTIKDAIELYDREQQRRIDSARLYEEQVANENAARQNVLIERQNRLIRNQRKYNISIRPQRSTHTSRNNDRKKKPDNMDLWGTAMCPYGKKRNGWTIGCNIGCPLWTKCGHH